MKKIFFAIVAVAAMASCAKEEVISVDRQAIQFGDVFVDNATRATDPTYGGAEGQTALTKFNVYGTVTSTSGSVNIYDGDEVEGTVGSNIVDDKETHVWSCDEHNYWVPGASYKFAAVVDANAVAVSEVNGATIGMPISLTYNTDDQKDLLYAATDVASASATQAPVNFSFSHLLSKVQFTVSSNTAHTNDYTGYYHTVTDIKVNNFQTGTYTISGGSWAGTTPKAIEFGSVEKVTLDHSKTNATQKLLIPTTAAYTVEFKVNLYKNGVLLGVIDHTGDNAITVNTALAAGCSYNFTIECSVGNPIQFSVTQDPTWTDGGSVKIQ